MNVSFASTRKKIALFFSLTSSLFILLTAIIIIFSLKIEIDKQVKEILTKGLETVSQDFQTDRLQEKGARYQTDNTLKEEYKSKRILPNIKSLDRQYSETQKQVVTESEEIDFDQLQSSKEMFSRVILPNGDILFTSDLFDNYFIDPQKPGFRKLTLNGVCIYSFTSIIKNGDNANTIVQTGQYCPISLKQEKKLLFIALVATIITSLTTYLGGLVVANWFLKPLQKSTLQIKEFAQNVYHELLTPVTVVMTTADATLRIRNYKTGILSIQKDLKDIYKSLNLLSSQAFCAQAKISQKETNISKVLQTALKSCSKKIRRKDIKINNTQIEKKVIKLVNPISVKLIFQNVIENALKYTKKNGSIFISLNSQEFIITNEIKNLQNINEKKFFQRFYRGENGKKTKGKGLGLSIAKELVEVHNWKIKVKKFDKRIKLTILFK